MWSILQQNIYCLCLNLQLFQLLAEKQTEVQNQTGHSFQFWLNVESFEYLRNDPCLPIDTKGSGMAELIDRSTKSRIDWAISVAGSRVNKIITVAWDSDWTCTTVNNPKSLTQEVENDLLRPIISECRWHSKGNMSIVIIGFNLLGLTQKLHVSIQNIAWFNDCKSLHAIAGQVHQ